MSEIQTKEIPVDTVQAEQGKVEETTEKESILSKFFGMLASIGIESKQSRIVLSLVLVIVFFSTFISFSMLPPSGFPATQKFPVKNGESLGQVSQRLHDENFIRSRMLFEFCVTTAGGDNGVKMGKYVFETPIGACEMALRFVKGDFRIPPAIVTIPEGFSNKQIATVLGTKILDFDTKHFEENARSLEGYLFPDTYYFLDDVSPEEVVSRMNTNFKEKIADLQPKIDASGHKLREIIIMASILEREATTDADRHLVSGVLWKRIKNGMALQVDAPFLYLLGKKSSEITQSDLQIKSAYNTYRNKGLPGGPIGNPGLATIQASLNPKESPYVYYLSDNEGVIHYAKTYSEHLANKNKYLR